MSEQALRCECGKVRGRLRDASPRTTPRIVCYCDDCQAEARFLKRGDLLDAQGGSDIVQTAPANLEITEGRDQIRCVRLSAKGLHRWYSACCNTPLGNTMGAGMPYVGIIAGLVEGATDGAARDRIFGTPRAYLHGNCAIGSAPAYAAPKVPLRFILRTMRQVLTWKLTGQGSPHPYFAGDTKSPVSTPQVLTPDERAALRA